MAKDKGCFEGVVISPRMYLTVVRVSSAKAGCEVH